LYGSRSCQSKTYRYTCNSGKSRRLRSFATSVRRSPRWFSVTFGVSPEFVPGRPGPCSLETSCSPLHPGPPFPASPSARAVLCLRGFSRKPFQSVGLSQATHFLKSLRLTNGGFAYHSLEEFYNNILTGSSMYSLKAESHSAPMAPSTTRWSQESVTVK
jgi:hypothetical protein